MDLIGLNYLTEEAYFREMARLYWQTNKKNKFVHNVADLAVRYNIRPGKLLQYVHESAEAYIRTTCCALCGTPTRKLERRADFYDLVRAQKWKLWSSEIQHFCTDCQEVMEARKAKKKPEKTKKSLVKSIFKTPGHLQVYKELRQEHFFIYPAVSFSLFIPKEVAEQGCQSDWEWEVFHRLVADFLVCDASGVPQKVIQADDQTRSASDDENRFQERILKAAALPLERIRT